MLCAVCCCLRRPLRPPLPPCVVQIPVLPEHVQVFPVTAKTPKPLLGLLVIVPLVGLPLVVVPLLVVFPLRREGIRRSPRLENIARAARHAIVLLLVIIGPRVIVLLLAVICRAVIVLLLVIIAPLVIVLVDCILSVRTNRQRQADGLIPHVLPAAWARHRLHELADGHGQRDRLRHHPAPAHQLGTVHEGALHIERRHCPGGGLILRTASATVVNFRLRGFHLLHGVHGLHSLHRLRCWPLHRFLGLRRLCGLHALHRWGLSSGLLCGLPSGLLYSLHRLRLLSLWWHVR